MICKFTLKVLFMQRHKVPPSYVLSGRMRLYIEKRMTITLIKVVLYQAVFKWLEKPISGYILPHSYIELTLT